jgi:hypothetical protein
MAREDIPLTVSNRYLQVLYLYIALDNDSTRRSHSLHTFLVRLIVSDFLLTTSPNALIVSDDIPRQILTVLDSATISMIVREVKTSEKVATGAFAGSPIVV